MDFSDALQERSGGKCELCSREEGLESYTVPPKSGDTADEVVAICSICLDQITETAEIKPDHWRSLNDSIWNPTPAVQVVANRILQRLPSEEWAQDLASTMYMDEETTEWANAMNTGASALHKDSNGNVLQAGDTVTLIKDLNVKGANFIAKRGTAVRRISLVHDNVEHIQGKVNGQTIIILTKFVKK